MCSSSAFKISGMVLTVKYAEQNHAEQNSRNHTYKQQYRINFYFLKKTELCLLMKVGFKRQVKINNTYQYCFANYKNTNL